MRVRVGVVLGVSALVLTISVAVGIPAAGAGASDAIDRTVAGTDCDFPYEAIDATGTEVRIPSEPEGVVTLNPSAAQTMWEIGARGKVVGLTKYASYLEGAGTRANVSGATDIVVVEQVVALEPDLVLAPNATSRETVDQLRGAGLTVYHFREAKEIEDVSEKTRTIGRLAGECAGAAETVGRMEARIDTVEGAVSDRARPDVLYAFFGYTAGRGTFVHEVIEAAGGNNVAADYGVTGYRKLNPEVVVEADPDWIIRNSNDPVMPEGEPFDSTTAVREGQVVVVPIQHLNQPAPRIVRGIATLSEHFHPEAFAAPNAANATNTANAPGTVDTARETPTPAMEPTPGPTTATQSSTRAPGQPGLGVVAGLVAMAAALLVARGRP